MIVNLMDYTNIIPSVRSYLVQNQHKSFNDNCSNLAVATFAPVVVINRMISAINGETLESERELKRLVDFYQYTTVLGEDELKRFVNADNSE